jgi:CheY-like chemotaxis protein
MTKKKSEVFMDKEIKILIVEDNASDAELITRELGKGGFAHITNG